MKLIKPLSGLAVVILTASFFSGCFSTDVGPTAKEQIKSDSVAAVGTEGLDDVFQEMSDDQFKYGEGNLTELKKSNAAFSEALRLDPENNEARLGAAITSVLLALQSKRLSELVNETADAGSPLNFNSAPDFGPKRVALLRSLHGEDRPEIHELQDAVADTLLPVLETAISQLQAVYNDAAFSLTLTIDGEEKEIDRGEVSVLLAGFKTLHAISTLVLAYDLDFDDNGSYAYLDVIDDIAGAHPRVGATDALRHGGVQPGEAAHVGFIDDGMVPRDALAAGFLLPVEVGVHHHTLGYERRTVALVEAQVVVLGADGVAEARRVPFQLAEVPPRIGVEQQLVGVEAVPVLRLVGAVHAKAVDGARADALNVAMPDFIGVFGQGNALNLALARGIEQADLHPGGMRRKQ